MASPNQKLRFRDFNPHGGNGAIGEEDDKVLQPTQQEIYADGTLLFGPYAADDFFGTEPQQFDAVLATYHDQGLIPFKTLTFGKGVNFTAGLNKVRTSHDHGTAYDIAGKGTANTRSFEEALFKARDFIFTVRNMLPTANKPNKTLTKGA